MRLWLGVAAVAAALLLPSAAGHARAESEPVWLPCATAQEPGAECASLRVPIDSADPGAGMKTVTVKRVPAPGMGG
ncbi:hypothetical protein [Amycolatopsis sp. NPDC059021]|uniref:hypothetical protein n=1 Tax=Amycolatopsis sp. NPDC059021 TaxID=3346704 RepID=UPI00366C3086